MAIKKQISVVCLVLIVFLECSQSGYNRSVDMLRMNLSTTAACNQQPRPSQS
ncbi:unnamed protein product, partial [Larinioides sclopetarius]